LNNTSANHITLAIKVTPNASKNEVLGSSEGIWRLKIAAPADKGKANKELIEFLSKRLRIRKSDVTIIKGYTSHNKKIAITGLTLKEVIARLQPDNSQPFTG